MWMKSIAKNSQLLKKDKESKQLTVKFRIHFKMTQTNKN